MHGGSNDQKVGCKNRRRKMRKEEEKERKRREGGKGNQVIEET